MERVATNDSYTPYFYGEQLVEIPLLLFYLGDRAICDYLAEHGYEPDSPEPDALDMSL